MSPTVAEVPPPFAVLDLMLGSMVTQAIYAAAELGVADLLHTDGPLTAEEIGGKLDANPDALDRLLRFLASLSIFEKRDDGGYALTERGDALRSDAPMSMRGMARLMGHPTHWADWTGFLEAVRTGEAAVPKRHGGRSMFEVLTTEDEDYGRVFYGAMTNLSNTETAPLVAAYDYSRFGTIVDVGAGRGHLLAAVLQSAPGSRGILFDERAVANGAVGVLAEAGVAGRATIEGGPLFGPVPTGDAYMLKHILHDWPQPQALEILRNIRAAISPEGRLLIMEFVLPEDEAQHFGKLIDLWLLLLVGGRERTHTQYADLLAAAGFRLEQVVPTATSISIVEARPV